MSVAELYDTEKEKFDSQSLEELYTAITGIKNATFEDIEGLLTNASTVNSSKFRANNGNKDIVVSLGGLNWTATYLSTVDNITNNNPSNTEKNGDIILDLWLAESETANNLLKSRGTVEKAGGAGASDSKAFQGKP